MTAIILLVLLALAALAAVRGLVAAAAALVVAVLVLSYATAPSTPLDLAQGVWQAAQPALTSLGQQLLGLGERAAALVMDVVPW